MGGKVPAYKVNMVFFSVYGVLACLYPFMTYYFQMQGLTYAEMGVAFALVSLTSAIAQPIWGYLADKYSNKRTILLIALTGCVLSVYSLMVAGGFWLVIMSIILVMTFLSPLVPVTDAYCFALNRHYGGFEYGRFRLMGSLGFALVALLAGWAVRQWGMDIAWYLYSALSLYAMALVLSIDFTDANPGMAVRRTDMRRLFTNRKVLLLLGAVLLTHIAVGSNGSYIAILMEATGGDVAHIGLLWFIVAISELPFLFYGAHLLRFFGELNLFVIGLAGFVLRYLLNSLCTSYLAVVVIQLMQGFTAMFVLMAALEYLNRVAPGRLRTVAMTVHAAAVALGGMIGNLGGGVLLEYVTIFVLYQILAVVCVAALVLVYALKKIDKTKRSRYAA